MDKINPAVVEWAMNRSGETIESLSAVSKRIDKWLDGSAQPTLSQIQEFARRTHITISLLFAEDVPHLGLQIADFRTPERYEHGGRSSREPSPELYDTINQMMYRQDWMHAYFTSQEYSTVELVGCLTGGTENPDAAAEKLRSYLEIGADWAFAHSAYESAFSYLKDAVEKAGISVAVNGMVDDSTNRILDPEEFRGFVLSDNIAPIVFINGRDAKVAQIFTLVHELAHLGYADIGVISPEADTDTEKREGQCDAIAAGLLMPTKLFQEEWRNDGNTYGAIDRISKRFKTSFVASARRAAEFGFISHNELVALCVEHRKMVPSGPKKTGKGGGNYYLNKRFRLGSVFSDAIWIAVNTRQLTYTEAFGLTGMKDKTFNRYFTDVAR